MLAYGQRCTVFSAWKVFFVEKRKSNPEELSDLEKERQQKQRRARSRRKRFGVVVDRIFGFLLATVIMLGIGGLAVEYVLIKGPSPALRDTFVMTMLETRRFRFIPRVYLTEAEIGEYLARKSAHTEMTLDPSLIQIPSQDPLDSQSAPSQAQTQDYGLVDEDGDGIIIDEVKGRGFSGKMIVVLDPSRCFIGDGGGGLTLNSIAERYGAIGGINGGAFYDPGGTGAGGQPEGLTIYDGEIRNDPGWPSYCIAGFTDKHLLMVGYLSYEDCVNSGIVSCVTFGPALIINGEPNMNLVSSVNPRTAIGQRADGAILMLVIDGRQGSSMGATHADLRDVMMDYGAVNACNLDGGSSSAMYYNGEIINMPSSASGGSRWLPNAFLFK